MVATCETCRFYALHAQQCRRRPPIWVQDLCSPFNWVWPAVVKQDWCGKHEPATPAPAAADDYTAAAVRLAEADAELALRNMAQVAAMKGGLNADDIASDVYEAMCAQEAAEDAFLALYREQPMSATVKVRILVRVWADGGYSAYAGSSLSPEELAESLDFLQAVYPPHTQMTETWLTAELPLPTAAEVAAQVEEGQ